MNSICFGKENFKNYFLDVSILFIVVRRLIRSGYNLSKYLKSQLQQQRRKN